MGQQRHAVAGGLVGAFVWAVLCVPLSHAQLAPCSVNLQLGSASAVPVGSAFVVQAQVCAATAALPQGIVLYPYLDGTQWGAHQALNPLNATSRCAQAAWRVPAPVEPGQHVLAVAAVAVPLPTAFPVGQPFWANHSCGISSQLSVTILSPPAGPPPQATTNGSRPVVCMEWEPWFTVHNNQWGLAEVTFLRPFSPPALPRSFGLSVSSPFSSSPFSSRVGEGGGGSCPGFMPGDCRLSRWWGFMTASTPVS
jgi:hypothetical protein